MLGIALVHDLIYDDLHMMAIVPAIPWAGTPKEFIFDNCIDQLVLVKKFLWQ